jgi:Bacterial dipeptidyl-peptidase Sh3 domain
VRDDLADVELADRVFAPHYAQAMPRNLTTAAALHVKPGGDMIVELAAGSSLELFDINGGWAWVRSASGMGYVPADALAPV